MASFQDQKEMLMLAIAQLQNYYCSVKESFEQLRGKALALLGGEIALVTFLFATPTNLGSSVPFYGITFFGLGIMLIAAAAVLITHCDFGS